MARVTVEDCMPIVQNRFALCILAVKRARQLMSGAKSFVEEGNDKAPVVSLRDIAAGKVRFDRDVGDVLSGKYNPPPVVTKLIPAGSRANYAPPSGGLF